MRNSCIISADLLCHGERNGCVIWDVIFTLQTFSKELSVSDDVLFLGWYDNPYKYISKSTVFALPSLPSLSEALPTVLVEAMVCGGPIVSTDCNYGSQETLHGGKCGILTKTLDDYNLPANEPLTNTKRDLFALKLSSATIMKILEKTYESFEGYTIGIRHDHLESPPSF